MKMDSLVMLFLVKREFPKDLQDIRLMGIFLDRNMWKCTKIGKYVR